ncbi:MAG TPA: histidine kinase [Candidatus Acidoferrales bacterium]|nr:histidine kinase [Candidatus Acidoferrales bacterium]
MSKNLHQLAQRYTATLKRYLADDQEAILEQAYELGRTAIANRFGILDMVRVHMEAREKLLTPSVVIRDGKRALKSAGVFFLQSLTPFEATHRGFYDTNLKLQQRNQEMEAEIGERRRAEHALRQSEKHYHQLFNEAQAMQENLRDLSNKVIRTQEEERKRISRELHDEVGQSLTAINVTLATMKNNGAGHSSSHRKLAEAQGLLQSTMETVHRFARDLRPAMLDELGLLPALRSYLKAFAARTGLRIHFHGNPVAEKLTGDQKIVVFRIAQESLTNVSKHAHAGEVNVAIRKYKDGITMEITDDGRSFKAGPLNVRKSKHRLGLLGMQERVRLVNGQFAIKPQPGKGTTVRVMIPFNPASTVMSLSKHQSTRS